MVTLSHTMYELVQYYLKEGLNQLKMYTRFREMTPKRINCSVSSTDTHTHHTLHTHTEGEGGERGRDRENAPNPKELQTSQVLEVL